MNIKAWSLLTGHPTFPQSLWPDLQDEVRPELRDRRTLYAKHLSDDARRRKRGTASATRSCPLHSAGKLGAVLLQWPRWFGPNDAHRAADPRRPAPACRTTGSASSSGAAAGSSPTSASRPSSSSKSTTCRSCASTSRRDSSRRCRPSWRRHPTSPSSASTAATPRPGRPASPSAAERFRYRYQERELREWVPKLRELAALGPRGARPHEQLLARRRRRQRRRAAGPARRRR